MISNDVSTSFGVLALFLTISLLMVFHLIQYFRHRTKQPLFGRFPLWSLLMGIGQAFYVVALGVLRIAFGTVDDPCNTEALVISVIVCWVASVYCIRCYLVFFTYFVQIQGVEYANENRLSEAPAHTNQWFIKNRRFLRPRFLIIYAVWVFILTVATQALQTTICGNSRTITTIGHAVLLLTNINFIVGILFTKESLHIRVEIVWSFIFVIFTVIASVLEPHLGSVGYFSLSTIFMVVFTYLTFCMSIVYPLWMRKKYIHSLKNVGSRCSVDVDFLEHIASPSGYAYFEIFLRLEFAVESLLFLREVEAYKKQPSVENSVHMYQDFVADDGRLQLNLSSKAFKSTSQILSSLCNLQKNVSFGGYLREQELSEEDAKNLANVFDVARDEIIGMLQADSFGRYLHSEQYEQFIQLSARRV